MSLKAISILLAAAGQLVTAQTCGSDARNTVISDDLFQSAELRDKGLPIMRDILCDFALESFCQGEGGDCTFSTTVGSGGDLVRVSMRKRETGNSAQLGNCNTNIDNIVANCIDGNSKVSSGTNTDSNVEYTVTLARFSEESTTDLFVAPQPASALKDLVPQDFLDDLNNGNPPGTPNQPSQTQDTTTPIQTCDNSCLSMRDVVKSKADDPNEQDLSKSQICTDSDNFIDSGSSADGNSDWFRITSQDNCFIMIAKSGEARGNSGRYCFTIAQINNFIGDAACRADHSFVQISDQPLGAQSFNSGQGMACLTDGANFQRCGEGIL
ncbi:hypothetical protein BDV96DRAFT_647931 [Lophiotrema nucula]|uniref:Uncharacterized protein n=1 Tax=Lophiotrema nucula TaxID=690887 RepID=A0A6A5Z2Q1_9PLEO|nr:hypothetical protein BDV96DRAFT_647931 [Lophiotrema nucula]